MNRLLAAAITVAMATSITGTASATAPRGASRATTGSPPPAAADTTVIDRAAIEQSGSTDLVELLRRQPGVDIEWSGSNSRVVHVLLRGASARQILVLVDGARVASAGSGEFDFASLALDQIERIEILRGPRSAQFGSDALGGVICITTRVPDTETARIYAGRYGRRGGSASASLANGTSTLGMTVGGESYDGDRRMPGFPAGTYLPGPFPLPDGPQSVQRNLSLVARTVVGDQQLSAIARHTGSAERPVFVPGEMFDTDYNLALTRNQSLVVELDGPLRPGWSHQLLITASRDRLETRYPPPASSDADYTHSDIDGRRESIDWRNRLAVADATELLLGVHSDWTATDFRYKVGADGSDESSGANRNPPGSSPRIDSSRQSAASIGVRYGAEGVDAELDLRVEHLSGVGSEASPQLSLGWQFHPSLQATLLYAEGFRAASLDERSLSPLSVYGYPDVEPEHVRTLEVGLLARPSEQQRIQVAAFRTRYDDLLLQQYVGGDPNSGTDEARADGVEFGYSWASGPWSLDANATVQDTRGRHGFDLVDGPLPFHPRQKAALNLSYQIGDDLRLATELCASSPRQAYFYDATNVLHGLDPDVVVRTPGYALVNLHAAWTPAPAWHVDLRLDNLADRRYTLAPFDVAPGRAWFASVRWAMP